MLTLWIDDVALSLEGRIVSDVVSSGIGVGQVLAVYLDEILAVGENLHGEGVETVCVFLLVFLDKGCNLVYDPWSYDIAADYRLCLDDGAFVVARDDGLLCLLDGGLCLVVSNEGYAVALLQGCRHHRYLAATLSEQRHAFHPGAYLIEHLRLIDAVGEELLRHGCQYEAVVGACAVGRQLGKVGTLAFATQSVACNAEIHVVSAEDFKRFLARRHEVGYGATP